jgi:hypothetical protein
MKRAYACCGAKSQGFPHFSRYADAGQVDCAPVSLPDPHPATRILAL